MNMTEMGEVYAFLLRYRMAESQPSGRKRRAARPGLISERDVCALLNEASESELQQLRQFLEGQGLKLAIYDAADYPGISPGSKLYLLQRAADGELPPMFSQQPVLNALRLRQESNEELAIWFMHLWLLLLSLLYTRNNRALSDVSLYQDALFSYAELVAATRQHLEQLRQSGVHPEQPPVTLKALLDEKGEDIPRRVRAFIELLEQAGHLQRTNHASGSSDDEQPREIYQQTLLGALEAEQIGLHHLRHILGDELMPATLELSEPDPSEPAAADPVSPAPAALLGAEPQSATRPVQADSDAPAAATEAVTTVED